GPAAGAFLGFLHGVGQVHAVLRVWRTAEEIRWSAHRVYSYTYRVQRSYLRRAVDSLRVRLGKTSLSRGPPPTSRRGLTCGTRLAGLEPTRPSGGCMSIPAKAGRTRAPAVRAPV